MAAPVNNIAATFSSSSAATTSLSSSSSSFSPRTSISLSSPSPAASWNPHHHSTRSWTLKSSLLDLYGSPAPLPLRPISTAHRRPVIPLRRPHTPSSTAVAAAMKLPIAGISLSYLDDRNKSSGAAVVRTATLAGLCKGKRRAVVVGVSAAFSPGCTRFLRSVMSSEAHRSAEMVACVARNDVFVMAAWGRSVRDVGGDGDVSRGRLVMLSDGGGELFGAVGAALEGSVSCGGLGLGSGGSRRGAEAERFCLSVSNGVVTSVSFDDEVDGEDDDEGRSRACRGGR